MHLSRRVARWILGHPTLVIAALVITTAVAAWGWRSLSIEYAGGNFVAEGSKVAEDFARINAMFGNSYTTMYVSIHDVDPADPVLLAHVETLTDRWSALEGVQSVLSITNIPALLRDSTGGLSTTSWYQPGAERDEIAARLDDAPLIKSLLVSADATLLVVTFEESFYLSRERVGRVMAMYEEAHDLPYEVAFAGFPYLRSAYAVRLTKEAPLFTGLALLVALIFLYVTFRSRRAVILPFSVVVLGVVWTLGLMGLLNYKLNVITSVLPPLLVIIGVANTIHFTTKFFERLRILKDRREAVVQTVEMVGLTLFLTSFTTAVGFGVLVFAGSHLLSEFGVFAALGVMFLYVIAMTLIPIVYDRIPVADSVVETGAVHEGIDRFFIGLGTFVGRRRTFIIVASTMIFMLGIWGASRISTDIFVFADFKEDDPVRMDAGRMEADFGGVLSFEVLLEAERPGAFRSLTTLAMLDRLEQRLKAMPEFERVLSPVSLVKAVNQAVLGGDPRQYRVPMPYEAAMLQQSFQRSAGLLEGGEGQQLPRLIDSTFSSVRMSIGVADFGTTRMNELADTTQKVIDALFPPASYTTTLSGSAIVNTRSGESLVNNLFSSLLIALCAIAILMGLLYRSPLLVLVSLIPNILPLVAVAGAMGAFGIPLKPSTAIIFPLAFGIAIDNTIHILGRYRLATGEADHATRLLITLQQTGKAILFTSMVLFVGFMIFVGSSFGGTVNLGALTAVTLAVALISNLLLLPALLSLEAVARGHRLH